MTIVRPASLQDAPAITALWNDMIVGSLATFTTDLKTDTQIRTMITARNGAFWVTENTSATVTGFATFGPFRVGPGYGATAEHTVIVAPSAQGQGTGRALLTTVQDNAAAQGIHILVAGISSANPAAVAFHNKLGFTQTARMPQVGRKHGEWLDLILMQKTISSP